MKYIETPVTPGKLTATLFEGSDILCVVDGTSGTSYQKRDDIMLAINEHDKLTGLHDKLVKQRDALFEALKEQELLSRHIRKCSAFDTQDGTCDTCLDLGYSAQKLRRVALALVRGKVEDETH